MGHKGGKLFSMNNDFICTIWDAKWLCKWKQNVGPLASFAPSVIKSGWPLVLWRHLTGGYYVNHKIVSTSNSHFSDPSLILAHGQGAEPAGGLSDSRFEWIVYRKCCTRASFVQNVQIRCAVCARHVSWMIVHRKGSWDPGTKEREALQRWPQLDFFPCKTI